MGDIQQGVQGRQHVIRLGVGLRAGASVGYLHYRREKSINPL